jgi:hypothetical protein
MTLRSQVILILLFGLATLYVVFFTGLLVDRRRMMALPPTRRAEAISYKAILIAALGLACVTFSTEYLIYGTRPLPYPLRASPLVLCLLVLTSAAAKRLRSRQ